MEQCPEGRAQRWAGQWENLSCCSDGLHSDPGEGGWSCAKVPPGCSLLLNHVLLGCWDPLGSEWSRRQSVLWSEGIHSARAVWEGVTGFWQMGRGWWILKLWCNPAVLAPCISCPSMKLLFTRALTWVESWVRVFQACCQEKISKVRGQWGGEFVESI